jgi:hypothetical protein
VDNKEYKELGESREKVNHHCKEIANIINAVSNVICVALSPYVEEERKC